MSIASIGSAPAVSAASTKLAPDGDTAAVEARETSAAQRAEKLNGGFAPKAAPATAAAPVTPGGISTLA